ncbi:mRNA splicing protein prp28 [Tulasnella sp. 424]|nr:mRNA splicing protein prp28 [Tulasnella sp. 424]KAG8978462.1 mRNA splicing protein prp28 [Tulasnella sp. 425]
MSKVPLSIESLLQKQKEEREAAAKPRFLTKEERAKLAIEKRTQEIREQKAKEEDKRRERETLEREADQLRHREQERYGGGSGVRQGGGRYDDRYGRGGRGGRDDHRERERPPPNAPSGPRAQQGGSVPTGPRADRSQNPPTASSSTFNGSTTAASSVVDGYSPSVGSTADAPFVPPMTESEIDAIRSRYLGVDKKKRKIRKMNDKKFVFDWDEQEDTIALAGGGGVRELGLKGGAVMFGRGHIAGMDDGAHTRGEALNVPGAERHVDPVERKKASKSYLDERHWSEKPLQEMKERDWRIFREDFSIASRGGHIPLPLRSWQESTIPPAILDVISQIGYEEPSPIQRQAIPVGLMNRDIIGIAETGSGKTAAFVIPMLVYISQLPPLSDDNRHLGPFALILAPTRELAQQIENEARKFAKPLGYTCVSIVGGRSVEEQQFNLREGAEIIIATPGRLKDVIDRHVLVLSQCTYVVMDEADRMVNLGFEADLNFILDALPSDSLRDADGMEIDQVMTDGVQSKGKTRVTTLFSATMPPAVERLAKKYLRKPAVITIGEAGRAVDRVEQRVEFVQGEDKRKARILDILNNGGFEPPIIVFVNQKKTADMVAKDLSRAGWAPATLHSGKNQEQREAALASLRTGESSILVATDLAGRGIDVQDVSLVINYQMSNTIEAYVHRIGRTGRAGKTGIAITFLSNDDDEVMYDLKQEISKSPVSKVPPELARHEAAQQKVTREMKRKRDGDEQD